MATESSIGLGGFSLSKDEIATSGFDHFAPQEIETGIKNRIREKFKPITSTGHMGPFKFDIPANPTYFNDYESIESTCAKFTTILTSKLQEGINYN